MRGSCSANRSGTGARHSKQDSQEGYTVHTASIRKPDKVEIMTPDEQQEARNTLMVLSQPATEILRAHIDCLVKNPAGYLRMAVAALRLMVKGPKDPVRAIAYFVEAGILLQWIRRNSIAHIHEHFANPTAIVCILMKRYGAITYSTSVHGPDIFYTVDSAMLQEKIREAAFVRCISHYCRSQVMRLADPEIWDRFHIVRCGIDPDLYSPRPDTGNTIPNLLCVGRLVPAKGQHILLEACAILKNQGTPFRLTFTGDGPDRASLEKHARSHGIETQVTFTGALGQDKVREQYDQADIFVLASFAEGVPVVLMEAMAKEIPVVSTRITGIPELIDHQHDGLLAVPGDPEDLARQLTALITDPDLRSRYGKAGRNKVIERYNQRRNNTLLGQHFLNQHSKP